MLPILSSMGPVARGRCVLSFAHFEFDDIDKPRLNCNPHRDIDISFAYNEDATANDFYTTNNMRKLYRYFNLFLRQTLVPKIGGA